MAQTTVPRARDGHVVCVYATGSELADRVAIHLATSLGAGGSGIVAATAEHRAVLGEALGGLGIDADAARRSGSLIELDAEEVATALLTGRSVDPDVFERLVGRGVRETMAARAPAHVFGEIVAVLWGRGYAAAAVEVERLWNDLLADGSFRLLCAYPIAIAGPEHAEAFGEIRRQHAVVMHAPAVPSGYGQGMVEELEVHLSPESRKAAHEARRVVADTVRRWGHAELIGDAELVATELVSNAIRHAASEFVLRLARGPGGIRIAVEDGSRRAVRMPRKARVSGGRGLMLVDALAARWGSEPLGEGKVVWAELEREGAARSTAPSGSGASR